MRTAAGILSSTPIDISNRLQAQCNSVVPSRSSLSQICILALRFGSGRVKVSRLFIVGKILVYLFASCNLSN
jgi:hypothetical protein